MIQKKTRTKVPLFGNEWNKCVLVTISAHFGNMKVRCLE